MERLAGVPVEQLAAVLVATMAGVAVVVAVLAVRNRAFLRLASRNVTRRRGRSALIVAGLMLATIIISSSLATGDTMARTIRSSALQSLGQTDEAVVVAGAEVDPTLQVDAATRTEWFDEGTADTVRGAVAGSDLVDGVAPAVVEPVAVQNATARRSEPRVTLFGAEPASMDGFGEIRGPAGTVTLDELASGEVYLTEDGAEDLGAGTGDRLVLYGGPGPTEVSVRDVVSFRGAGTDGAAVLAPLELAQATLGQEGLISQVLVSNAGDETGGADHTRAVVDLLSPAVTDDGLEVRPVKQDALELADEQGATMMSIFSTFGTFAIAAGVLLIFLVFAMLASERRSEMGVSRALGTQRGHLVQTFVFEGALYDLAAAAIGALAGLAVAFLMVQAVASGFGGEDLTLEHAVRPASLVVAYGLGVLLTLAVVAASAWRVSVLDVVTAIRNLPPRPARRSRRSGWVAGIVSIVVGAAIAAAGASSAQATPFLAGVSIVIVGLVPVARSLGAGERLSHTVAGLALVGWWLLPSDTYEAMVGQLSWDFSVWIVAGLLVVLGATWTIMYNADAALGAVSRAVGRVRSLAPVIRMAVAYPLRSRLRTSMTLAMFMLVVFTLVTGSTVSGSFISAFDDVERFGGGFDVRAVTAPIRPVDDLRAALEGSDEVDVDDITAVGTQSMVPVEVRQHGTEAYADYPVRGVDRGFTEATTYDLAAMATGFGSSEEVWQAVGERPGLAVVDPWIVPRRNAFVFGSPPDLQLQGFYIEDVTFDPVDVEIRDPATGTTLTLTVIGVLDDTAPFEMAGVTASQETLAPLGDRASATTHWIDLAEGTDPEATATALESALFDHGLEARSLRDRLEEAVSDSWTINRLIQGFLGLGLVVGVVALGVVSARAVVERRQQIGVLRAIGFQPSMVRLAFLAEASFVSLVAIVVGCVLGLALSYNIVTDLGEQQAVELAVPWVDLLVVFAVVYAASLASTLAPAVRASRTYPAEALRYE
ncbi:MAG TPA: FtsX-like permease family protein [Acidimicrobiales bacterium]